MSRLLKLLRAKWNPPAKTTSTFEGKTVIITGANTGLGFQAAHSFLDLSAAHLVLAVRNTSKGDAARDQLEAQTGRSGAISVLELDMNSFASVKRLQVNILSTTLLALLLLPKLRSARLEYSASFPHLVLVSSGLHAGVARSSLPSPPENILSFLSTRPEPATTFSGPR